MPRSRSKLSPDLNSQECPVRDPSPHVKRAWIFPLYFRLPYLPEETCFQQTGSSAVEGPSQVVLGSSDQRNVLASVSLFLKVKKSQLCFT